MKKTKHLIALLLILSLLLSLVACGTEKAAPTGQPQTRTFTDSVGRTVSLPYALEKVAVSGPMAQMVLFALCPDKLVGLASEWDPAAEEYLDTKYYKLPVLGQLYGGKGELNLETLLGSGAQVVIDIGEPKDGIVKDLNDLQEQTQLPFVHISMTTETMAESYRLLGELLNMPEEAENLAAYCEQTYDRIIAISQSADKVRLLYLTGEEGHNVIAKGSYHAEVIDLLSENLAVVSDPSGKGTGNEVDVEQLLTWNPDVILVAPDSVYDSIGSDPLLQNIQAVKDGRCYEVPQGPYNWMGFPPSVQRLLGMLWMAKLLYPSEAEYDLCEEVTAYYELFYHCELTAEQYHSLVANSIEK